MIAPYVPGALRRGGLTGLLGLLILILAIGSCSVAGVSSARIIGTGLLFVPMTLVGAGALAALFALPPLRAVARLNHATRVVTVLLVAGVVLVTCIGLWAWNYAGFTYSSVTEADRCEGEGCAEGFTELTWRHAVPPPMRDRCFTGLRDICKETELFLLDAGFPTPENGGWPEYGLLWALSLIPALFAGVLVWKIAKPLPPPEPLPSLKDRRPPEAWRA